MNSFTRVLLLILRIAFLAALALGLALWAGHGYQYLKLHMWIGFAITFDLLLLAIAGFLARLTPALPLITVLWAALLPFVGIWQMRAVPGSNHWMVQVLHLIIALGAIGLGEAISKRILRRAPAR